MDFTYAELSSSGPVRSNNEDFVGWHRCETLEERRSKGAVIIIADGVGGHGGGEIASQLAVTTAIEQFIQEKTNVNPKTILSRIFDQANMAVYDLGMKDRTQGRMATTMTISLLRNDEMTIGHVGDCRTYLVRRGKIQRLTSDHSYVGMQLKMGLISEREAMTSDLRSMLTRTVGQNMSVAPDFSTVKIYKDDVIVQCSDGLHGWVTDAEICEAISLYQPKDACRFLLDLSIKRKCEDNVTLQVLRMDKIEHVGFYRGMPFYIQPRDIPNAEVQVGQTLDNRFLITEVIARSAVSTIFKAVDSTNEQQVAVKVPFEQYRHDPIIEQQLIREEEIGKSFSHPWLMRVVPVEKKSRPYLVMELLEGQTLSSLLLNVHQLPVADAVKIAARLCDALDYMHRRRMNVIHRDLKPENIMICNDGSIRIMDFGIAKATGSRSIPFFGYTPAVGTPDYLAPEQVKGARGDERTDIYSMGVILYEMVTGHLPFDGSNAYAVMNARVEGDPVAPRTLNPEISPAVEEVILHAMERRPDDRFNSAAEMKEELEALEKVKLHGRHERLKIVRTAPRPQRSGLLRLTIWLLVLPVIFILLFFIVFHKPLH